MLTYGCTNACRHCHYRCGPNKAADRMTPAMLERVLDALAEEPRLSGVHLAGGEATMEEELLAAAITGCRARGIGLDYLETNGGWCVDEDAARAGFAELRDLGLDAVLISASLFHNEFIPFRVTRTAIAAAAEVFGPGGVIVWTPNVFRVLEALPTRSAAACPRPAGPWASRPTGRS